MRKLFTLAIAAALPLGCDSGQSNVLGGVPAIAYISRSPVDTGNVFDYTGNGKDGNLFTLSPPTASGKRTNLTNWQGGDVNALDLSFDAREIFGIRLALEEALVNAVKHGNRLDPLKKVEIQFTVQTNRFDVQITDEGPGYIPEKVPDCKADENLTRPGGRGLFLMRHYMTEVLVRPPGNQLVMSKIHANGAGGES